MPSNINWENIGYSVWRRLLRIVAVLFFVAALLVLGSALIILFTSFREKNKEILKYMGEECFKKISIDKFLAMEAPDYQTTYCFCSMQDKLTILNNSDVKEHCFEYLKYVILFNVMKFLGSVLITVVDILLAYFIYKIVRFVNFRAFNR